MELITLDNGTRIALEPMKDAMSAAIHIFVACGSANETEGEEGAAHFVEHMMFKGTPDVPAGEFSKRVAAAGGRDNAFTSNDYTAYFQQIPSHKLEAMMALESDRMKHLSLDEHEFHFYD